MEFRKDINGLRALAVLLVLLFHFGASRFDAGFIGVDIFFVISGFLMTGIILRGIDSGSFSVLRFYQARLVRLYPALLATVAATLAFGLVFIEPAALAGIARHGISALLFVSNVVFWRESGYFGAPAETMWFLHTWSLSVEWQFYLIYPVVLTLAALVVRSRRGLFVLLFAATAASLALSIASAGLFANERLVSFGFYMLPGRAWEMLAGGLIALSPNMLGRFSGRSRTGIEATGLAAIGLSLAFFSQTTPWPSFHALLPVAGTMLVLAANAPRSLLAARLLQHIGSWSYSIYLWHWPVVAALAYFGSVSVGAATAAFLLSLFAGWMSFRFIEQPSSAWLKGARDDGVPKSLRHPALGMGAIAAAALGVMALGGVTIAGNGLPQRSPATLAVYEETLAAAADYAFPLGRCGGTSTFGDRLKPCTVGSPSQHDDVLVIGDSFAEMWFSRIAAIDPLLRDHAVVFVTKGGCPPIAGMERLHAGAGCGAFRELAMEQARDPRYRTIIIAGMWASYFTKEQPNSVVCEKDGCISTGTAAGLEAAVRRFAAEIQELSALDKKVVVLTTSPYPGFNVASELRKRLFAGEDVAAGWSFDFGAILAGSQPIDAAIAALGGAEIIDLPSLLCGGMVCPALQGMAPLYTDTDHLRSSYTASAGAFLDRFVLPVRLSQAEQQ